MIKKLFFGALLLGGIILFTGAVSADNNERPWQLMSQFRGEEKLTAQDMDMDKESFIAYRDSFREKHREERMAQRQERLLEAVEKGCLSQEEMEAKMQKRNGRFRK